MLYLTLIQPYLEYGISLWGATHESYTKKLKVSQKKAIRVITHAQYNEHTNPLFCDLKILKLDDLYKLHVGKYMYKTANDLLPKPLKPLFSPNYELHEHNTRQSGNPHIRQWRTIKASNHIIHKGPEYWQSIATEIKTVQKYQAIQS